MPKNKDLKRRVRARMRKTGEAYTAARARLLERGEKTRAAAPPPLPRGDLAELAGMSDEAVERKTGRRWRDWCRVLDRAGAHAWPHPDVARHLRGEHELGSWWAQTVTVGYERIRGLREKGQRRDGGFDVNKSKTFAVPVEELWDAFARVSRWVGEERPRTTKATRPRRPLKKSFGAMTTSSTPAWRLKPRGALLDAGG